MKLFGKGRRTNSEVKQITVEDRIWVEDGFQWLIEVYGYPNPDQNPLTFSKEYFPKTFAHTTPNVNALVADLCYLLYVSEEKVQIHTYQDLSDAGNIPYEYHGTPSEVELEVKDGLYHLHVSNAVLSKPKWLLSCLILEFVKIRLTESNLKYDTGEDTAYFLFIAATFFGFGIPISQSLVEIGYKPDIFWTSSWKYVSIMPEEVMVFILALYAEFVEPDKASLIAQLPKNLHVKFNAALQLLETEPSELINPQEQEAKQLLNKGFEAYDNCGFNLANEYFLKAIDLNIDQRTKALFHNNIGYNYLRLKQYQESIDHFKQAIDLDPNFAYPRDNLGYALIQLGQLEEGKKQLDLALNMNDNDAGYSCRNLGLYYMATGDLNKSEELFKKAFEVSSQGVDLLEYHFSELQKLLGNIELSKEMLKKAVAKGEPEAVELWKKTFGNL